MKRKPAGEQHDLDRNERHAPPGYLLKEGEGNAGQDIAPGGPPGSEDGLPGPDHVGGIGAVPGHFKRQVGLDGTAYVEAAPRKKRPAVVRFLAGADIVGQFPFERSVDLVHVVHHQDVLGRDGAVRFQFETPVPFRVLRLDQGVSRPQNGILELPLESGTGKELVARAIHYHGARKNGPFEAVNCGGIPETLQESEFFGYQKGAFTGATQSQAGKIEMAEGGTLFLDEIGEMTPAMQIKLLRFLQDKTFEPVGGRYKITVDVRIISATNKDLEKEVEKGTFREDLYYRLVVFPITIPPLRERKEDIPAMINHFFRKYEKETGKKIHQIDHRAMEAIMDYDWPGNVRELESVIYRAMVICDTDKLKFSCLPPHLTQKLIRSSLRPAEQPTPAEQSVTNLAEIEKSHILKILKKTNWRIEGSKGAAILLGLHPNTLRGRMQKLGIHLLKSSE